MAKKTRKNKEPEELDTGIGGFLEGLTSLVGKLGELAETGKELSQFGEISGLGPGNKLKGVYGFNIKVGLGQDKDKIKVEPFGNIKRDKESGQAVVQEIREPLVDVLEEDDHTLIVAEMPGISEEDVKLDVKDDVLIIVAERGEKRYRKEVLLPRSYSANKVVKSCKNGMLEIRCNN